jgi:hypothetical protein
MGRGAVAHAGHGHGRGPSGASRDQGRVGGPWGARQGVSWALAYAMRGLWVQGALAAARSRMSYRCRAGVAAGFGRCRGGVVGVPWDDGCRGDVRGGFRRCRGMSCRGMKGVVGTGVCRSGHWRCAPAGCAVQLLVGHSSCSRGPRAQQQSSGATVMRRMSTGRKGASWGSPRARAAPAARRSLRKCGRSGPRGRAACAGEYAPGEGFW